MPGGHDINPAETLLTPAHVAALYGLSQNTLRNWRHLGRGPSYVKLGSAVRYPESALREFLAARLVSPVIA